MALPEDLVRYVERSFAPGDREPALEVLGAAVVQVPELPERLLRCAAVSANRDLGRLRRQVAHLAVDYRDVIVEGEYVVRDGRLLRVRNLDQPIPEDTQ
jgi:hypothetical protein